MPSETWKRAVKLVESGWTIWGWKSPLPTDYLGLTVREDSSVAPQDPVEAEMAFLMAEHADALDRLDRQTAAHQKQLKELEEILVRRRRLLEEARRRIKELEG